MILDAKISRITQLTRDTHPDNIVVALSEQEHRDGR
jgi:hypothetical protein